MKKNHTINLKTLAIGLLFYLLVFSLYFLVVGPVYADTGEAGIVAESNFADAVPLTDEEQGSNLAYMKAVSFVNLPASNLITEFGKPFSAEWIIPDPQNRPDSLSSIWQYDEFSVTVVYGVDNSDGIVKAVVRK